MSNRTRLLAVAALVLAPQFATAGKQSSPGAPTTMSISVQGTVFNIAVDSGTVNVNSANGFSASIPVASLPPAVASQLSTGNVSPAIQALLASFF